MRWIVLLKEADPFIDTLWPLMNQLSEHFRIDHFQSAEELEAALRTNSGDTPDFVLLAAPDQETLESLVAMADLLRDLTVVAVVTGVHPEAASLAHRLHPRYLHRYQDHTKDLLSVLSQMPGGGWLN